MSCCEVPCTESCYLGWFSSRGSSFRFSLSLRLSLSLCLSFSWIGTRVQHFWIPGRTEETKGGSAAGTMARRKGHWAGVLWKILMPLRSRDFCSCSLGSKELRKNTCWLHRTLLRMSMVMALSLLPGKTCRKMMLALTGV